MLSYYRDSGYDISNSPQAYKNYSRLISLPVYYDLSDEQVKIVINAVIDSVEEVIT